MSYSTASDDFYSAEETTLIKETKFNKNSVVLNMDDYEVHINTGRQFDLSNNHRGRHENWPVCTEIRITQHARAMGKGPGHEFWGGAPKFSSE